MATEEYYIRNESDEEARGPFIFEQLSSLAENGQVTRETLYYDAMKESWVTVGSDAELVAQLWPEKRKLSVKRKEQINSLNKTGDDAAPIEVTDMLAAAEGRTADTKDKVDPAEAMARNAKIGMQACTVTLLISAAALLAPSIDKLVAGDYVALLKQPFAVLGAIDFVLGLLLLLQTVALYPFIRFRAALGAGFLGLVFWSQGEPLIVLAVIAGSLGLYFSTVFTSLIGALTSVVLGLVGMGWFAYAIITR